MGIEDGRSFKDQRTFERIVFGSTNPKTVDNGVDIYDKEIAEQLDGWKSKVLGREIEIHSPLTDLEGNRNRESVTSFYALPFTDNTARGHDKRVLLVYPHIKGYELFVVAPNKSTKTDLEDATYENEGFLSDFDAAFLPSKIPHIVRGWEEDILDPADQLKNVTYIKILPTSQDPDTTSEKVLEMAVKIAIKIKEQKEVNELIVNDATLKTLFGPEDVAFLTGEGIRSAIILDIISDYANDPENRHDGRADQIEGE